MAILEAVNLGDLPVRCVWWFWVECVLVGLWIGRHAIDRPTNSRLTTPPPTQIRLGNGSAVLGLDVEMDFAAILSLGEQQRLAFGRLLYNRCVLG